MDLKKIQEIWKEDSKINMFAIEKESVKIAELHSKYYDIMLEELQILKKMEQDYKTLYKDVWKFYNKMGKPEDYQNYDDDGFFDKKVLKTDKEIFIDSDQRLKDANLLISGQKAKIEFLDSIIKMIFGRSYQIKNFIEMYKYQNGDL